jgi:3-oxoacyl-[acyl-carrier protein] reductase
MDLGLKGRTALVAGASRGIGKATATILAEEGCDLVLVARDETDLERTAAEIAASTGAKISVEACDLSQADAPQRLSERFPGIDILVNNAGAVPPGSVEDLPIDAIRNGWALKVFGYLSMVRAFYPLMKQRRSGVIVNVIGMAGERVNAKVIALTGGNAALIAMTRALGAEAPDNGVRVVGVNPAMTATDRAKMLWRKQASEQLGDEERWPELVQSLPFGRAAEPADIASAIAFLASPRAGYISGSIVNIDGGLGARP